MEYKTINLNAYKIHFIKTNKFKTIDIRVLFIDEFKKEDITKRNFLFDILNHSTKKYNTKRLLNIKCQELYSLFLTSSNFRMGNFLISRMGVSFLNPKYTDQSMLEESIDLLIEALFNPNIKDNHFDEDIFKQIKNDLEMELKTIKEQPRVYATTRLMESMGKNEAYTSHGFCYQDDLDKINPSNLYDYYQGFLRKNDVSIFVVGDFDMDNLEQIIRDKFKINTLKRKKGDMFIKHDKFRKRIHKVIEEGDYKQSKLLIGLKLKPLTLFERKYVSNIYNMILGGSSDSYLMQNVREKSSLAYYIGSSIDKADNIIYISCGIESNNYEKALKLIKKTIKQLNDGLFSEEDIKKAQMEYISTLEVALSSASNLMDLKLSQDYKLTDDVETRKKEILKVTKEDVIQFSEKVIMDTVYLLKGE